jgi:hypothetical protein
MIGVRCAEVPERVARMTVSSENQFYLELGVIKGWALFFEKEIPERVKQAIRKLEDLGLGVIGKSEEQLREEVDAQAHLMNDVLNDIEDLKQLGSLAVRLASDPQLKVEVGDEIKQIWEEAEQQAHTEPAPVNQASSTAAIPDDRANEVRTLSETMTDDQIAHELTVSRDTVIRFRKKHGIEKPHGVRAGATRGEYQWEPWQKQKLIEMKRAGASYGEIAKVVGKTPNQCSGMWFWEKKKLDSGASSPAALPDDERPDSPPERLISAHNSYAGKRDPQPNPLQESDWPDIEQMLNKQRRSVSQIASDYEVDFDTMRAFIDEHQEPPPGEPQPSKPSVAVPAA